MSDDTLVVLPNWFGETLFAVPFLQALRARASGERIVTLGWPQCRDVLLHHPAVDGCLDYDERGRHRNPSARLRLVAELRRVGFARAFILRPSLSRSLLLALAGIPERIGFAAPKSGWLLTRRVPRPARAHKAMAYLALLEVPPSGPLRYSYAVSPDEREAVETLLVGAGALDGRPLVMLHPGANWPHKRWAPERFAALGDRLASGQGVRIAITGGPHDGPLARRIAAGMREPALVLAGRTTLRELAACLERAELVISNDTGVTHLASALGRPIVALFGPTDPTLTGPLGDPQRIEVVHHPDCCPEVPCYRAGEPPHLGMDAITVEEAHAAALRLLARAGG